MFYKYVGKTPIRLKRVGLVKPKDTFECDYVLHEPMFIKTEEPKKSKSKKVTEEKK